MIPSFIQIDLWERAGWCLAPDRRFKLVWAFTSLPVHRGEESANCNITVDTVADIVTILGTIKSFRHKGLAELFELGRSRKVRPDLQSRALRRLDALDQAESVSSLNIPGFDFHGLHGKPKRYSIHVNGPWCITFEWEDGDASKVDLEQYH